jgi:hypothetical protein
VGAATASGGAGAPPCGDVASGAGGAALGAGVGAEALLLGVGAAAAAAPPLPVCAAFFGAACATHPHNIAVAPHAKLIFFTETLPS